MAEHVLRLGDPWFRTQLGRVIAEARRLVGWSQRELADRAGTSQAAISRLETGVAAVIDLVVVERVLVELGLRGWFALDAPHLRDRTRQRDPVHARIVGYVARRLDRAGWQTATEVPIGDRVPRGWIDLLAHRPADGAGIIGEIKADVPDMGELQRQVGFYARAGAWAARPLGWRIERSVVLVAALDSAALIDRLSDNREVVRRAFPGRVQDLDGWIRSATVPAPTAPTIALVDPASRRDRWLRPIPTDGRRAAAAYTDYANAALRLRSGRRR